MKRVVLAYSGGLDTSFCVPYLISKGYEVATITVDTGGFTRDELATIAQKAVALGAKEHRQLDSRKELFERFGGYIIKGNILRGDVYPLCVGAERGIQAEKLIEFAKEWDAAAVCHGCTGAGNDQVRFDVSIRSLAPKLEIIAPIRELALSRDEELAKLKEWGQEFPAKKKKYSINQGILGTTIGGGETHDSWAEVPEEAYVTTVGLDKAPAAPEEVTITFEKGEPVALNGERKEGFKVLIELNQRGGAHGFGRGIHLGDTVLGIKGRIAFEAPGALTLIGAHRELEKLVLTKWQAVIKKQVAELYGMLVHEGQYFNPALRDIEALIDSSQERVTGEVRVRFHKGTLTVLGARSPHSLMDSRAKYGEGAKLWTSRDAEGFCLISGVQSMLVGAAGHSGENNA